VLLPVATPASDAATLAAHRLAAGGLAERIKVKVMPRTLEDAPAKAAKLVSTQGRRPMIRRPVSMVSLAMRPCLPPCWIAFLSDFAYLLNCRSASGWPRVF
jgi:hypothetical protein